MGSTPDTTTARTETVYPPWLAGAMRNNIGATDALATQLGEQGYQSYTADNRVAPLNSYQNAAAQSVGQNQGNWAPSMQAAAGAANQSTQLASQAASGPVSNWGYDGASSNAAYAGPSSLVDGQRFTDANVNEYLNPFHSAVTLNTLGNIEQSRQLQNMQIADAATKAKAFGGSRHGVVESQTNAAFAKQAADTTAQLHAQNFGAAQQQINADQNRNLQAQGMNQAGWNAMNQFNAGLAQQTGEANANRAQQAGMFNAQLGQERDMFGRNFSLEASETLGRNAGLYSDLARQQQSLSAADANNLLNIGNQWQDQDQLLRDHTYQEFLNARQFPIDLLNLRYSGVTNTPWSAGSATTTPVHRNRTAGAVGGAVAGAQAGGTIYPGWGHLIGGVLGAAGGYYGA